MFSPHNCHSTVWVFCSNLIDMKWVKIIIYWFCACWQNLFQHLFIICYNVQFIWICRCRVAAKSKGNEWSWKFLEGVISFRWGSLKPAFYKERISLQVKLVPTLTAHTSGMFGTETTHFFFVPLTHLSMSSLQKKKSWGSNLFFR